MFGPQESKSDKRDSLVVSLLRSLLVVVPTYLLVAWSLGRGYTGTFDIRQAANTATSPVFAGLLIVVFTFSHGVFPVFFYRFFQQRAFGSHFQLIAKSTPQLGCFFGAMRGFVILHMSLWYGVPIIILSLMTGWWNVVYIVVHVALAGRGMRQWAFLEHGSNSLALVFFLTFFRADNFYPVGIVVVILQGLLLTLVDWKGRQLWSQGDGEKDD